MRLLKFGTSIFSLECHSLTTFSAAVRSISKLPLISLSLTVILCSHNLFIISMQGLSKTIIPKLWPLSWRFSKIMTPIKCTLFMGLEDVYPTLLQDKCHIVLPLTVIFSIPNAIRFIMSCKHTIMQSRSQESSMVPLCSAHFSNTLMIMFLQPQAR